MAKKYYFTPNAARSLVSNGKVITFEKTEFSSSNWYGVYATDDKADQKILDAAVESKTIKKLTKKEFDFELKKKARLSTKNLATPILGVAPNPNADPAPTAASEPAPEEEIEIDEPSGSEHSAEEAENGEPIE